MKDPAKMTPQEKDLYLEREWLAEQRPPPWWAGIPALLFLGLGVWALLWLLACG